MQGLGPLAALGFVVTLLEPRNQMSYQSFNSELRFKLSKPPDPSTFDRNSQLGFSPLTCIVYSMQVVSKFPH
jgi:hypothetical protein